MSTFSVRPDSLRESAAWLQRVSDDAGVFTDTCATDVGHPGLALSLSLFAAQSARDWQSAAGTVAQLAQRLRQSADLYESADEGLAAIGLDGD
ncbi:type VII secretion target [Microbacterium sp. NPDC090007]|uniref:type VII secretion target n=1 Tax=Microbacterium sp. NPDC090007 TaxID=3364204 RepID=UPI0037F2FABF